MTWEIWPQLTYLTLLIWGTIIQRRAGKKAFQKTLLSGGILCFILYFGGFFDPLLKQLF